ncbi:hypothetical protein KAR28_04250 [Candidatus Parcubacteria bacterium]|nr:hypothetical protein [Candidatus Parcubacteria bacterium]
MTYQISKNLNTHVILTYAGSKYYITAKQEIALRKLSDNDKFYNNDRMVRVNTIKEIMPIAEYYNSHPKERPHYNNYDDKKLPERLPYSAKRQLKNLKAMRNGFLRNFYNKEISGRSKEILENINTRIDNFKHGNVANPAQVFFGDKS